MGNIRIAKDAVPPVENHATILFSQPSFLLTHFKPTTL